MKIRSVTEPTTNVSAGINVLGIWMKGEIMLGKETTGKTRVNTVATLKPCPKIRTVREKKYLEFIKQQPCVVCKRKGPNDPHHTKVGGKGLKGSDRDTISLCHAHHVCLHNMGRTSFADANELDYEKEIERLNKLYDRTISGV